MAFIKVAAPQSAESHCSRKIGISDDIRVFVSNYVYDLNQLDTCHLLCSTISISNYGDIAFVIISDIEEHMQLAHIIVFPYYV